MLFLTSLALIAASLAAPPAVHWASLPAPEARPGRYLTDGDDLVVAGVDGSLHRWQESEWLRLDGPPAGISDTIHGFAMAPDGTTWLTTKEYAWSWRPDRGWSDREAIPTGYVFSVDFDADGTPWAVGIHGYVARRTDEGWKRLLSLPLGDGVDSNLTRILFDRDGIGWAYEHYGQVVRIEGTTGERIHLHDEAPIQVTLDAAGRPLLLGKTVRYLDTPESEPVIPHHATNAYQHQDGWWVNIEGQVNWYEDSDLTAYPLPATDSLRGLLATDAGKLYAVDMGGNLYETQAGSAPVLREVAEAWGLSALSDRKGTWVADVDGDGLDDLLVLSATGELQLLIQAADGFVEATAAWKLSLSPTEHLAICDLDGNGQPDLLAREASTDLSEDDGRVVKLRYLRALDGWFEDATDDIQGPDYDAVSQGTGALTCADVDADGDQDLLVAGGQRSLSPGPRIVLYENVGRGHLVVRGLPARGLGMAWGGWVEQAVPGDLNADGQLDFVGLVWWNRGHLLLEGTPGGGVRDATRGSSLNAVYAWPERGWITRIDDDVYPDLVIADQGRMPRVWRGHADLTLEQATQAWGLAPFQHVGAGGVTDVELGDLDGDGQVDLLATTTEQGLFYLHGTPGGPFEDHSDILPRPKRPLVDVALLDLGGDGDQDLLVLSEGQDLLLEQLGTPRGPPVVPPSRTLGGELIRRLDWLRARQDGPLIALLFASFLAGFILAWRSGSRLALGHWLKGSVALSLACAGYLLAADSPLLTRGLLSGGISTLVLIAAWAERRYHLWVGIDKLGSYRLLRYLGAGGMGTVFEAASPAHDEHVALKILKQDLTQELDNRLQFRSEALAMAAIEDERVVGIKGSHSEERFVDGQRVFVEYLVMELVEGTSLRSLLTRRGQLPPGEAAWAMKEVAEVLEEMHGTEVLSAEDVRGTDLEEPPPRQDDERSAGGAEATEAPPPKRLVHRDIKPDNIMITRTGGLKLMDFGAAMAITDQTRTVAQLIGTEAYIPPEIREGVEHDARSDLWAMGVTLYELICGCRPFEHASHARLITMIETDTPRPPHTLVEGLDPELSSLIMHCLEKDPEQRIPSAGELARRLAPHATGRITLKKEELAAVRSQPPGTKLALLPHGKTLDHLDIAWLLTKNWWAWSRSTDEPAFDSLVASLVKHTVSKQGGNDSLVHHLQRQGVDITTASALARGGQRRDVEHVQIGAPKQPGGRGRRRAAVAKPPPATVVGKGDET